jgi:hypothetical protein
MVITQESAQSLAALNRPIAAYVRTPGCRCLVRPTRPRRLPRFHWDAARRWCRRPRWRPPISRVSRMRLDRRQRGPMRPGFKPQRPRTCESRRVSDTTIKIFSAGGVGVTTDGPSAPTLFPTTATSAAMNGHGVGPGKGRYSPCPKIQLKPCRRANLKQSRPLIGPGAASGNRCGSW